MTQVDVNALAVRKRNEEIKEIQKLLQDIKDINKDTQASLYAIQAKLTAFQVKEYELRVIPLRARNAVQSVNGPLIALPMRTGGIPEHFPATHTALAKMKEATLDPILAAYGLPLDGRSGRKRKRLAKFISKNL